MEEKEIIYKPSNREKKLKAKKSKFWCVHCDAQLVGEYSKCPNCKQRNGKKRFKKPYNKSLNLAGEKSPPAG